MLCRILALQRAAGVILNNGSWEPRELTEVEAELRLKMLVPRNNFLFVGRNHLWRRLHVAHLFYLLSFSLPLSVPPHRSILFLTLSLLVKESQRPARPMLCQPLSRRC